MVDFSVCFQATSLAGNQKPDVQQKKLFRNELMIKNILFQDLIWLRELDLNQRPSGYEPEYESHKQLI